MKTIKQSYLINASVIDVWQALVDPHIIDQWGGGPAKMSDQVGADFELWGGDVYGKNREVVPQRKLVQEWFSGDWDEPSILTIHLHKKKADVTIIDLIQERLPSREAASVEQGWKDYYMNPLKKLLEEK